MGWLAAELAKPQRLNCRGLASAATTAAKLLLLCYSPRFDARGDAERHSVAAFLPPFRGSVTIKVDLVVDP